MSSLPSIAPNRWLGMALLPLLLLSSFALADDEIDAKAVIAKSLARYKAMESYSDEGTVVTDITTNQGSMRIKTTFSTKLRKPGQYLVSWTQKNITGAGGSSFTQAGAVWNDGTQPYLYLGASNSYSKLGNDMTAIASATGISGGAANTIPALFLPGLSQFILFPRLIDPKIERTEKIAGEECYVISGASKASKKETLWISKAGSLLVQTQRSMEPPPGGLQIPTLTDAQIDETLRNIGRPVDDENRKKLRATLKEAEESQKTTKLSGTTTETHTHIEFPNLDDPDFAFTPPAGTVMKDAAF